MTRKKNRKAHQRNLDLLTPKQQAKYEDSLSVLDMMRDDVSFNKATNLARISPPTVKKFLGKTLTKRNNRIIARKNDSLIRELRIYENGKEKFIQVRGSKKSKRVGQYHSAVGKDIDKKESTALNEFQDEKIVDIFGKSHFFETDIETIRVIFQRRENPALFNIYKSR